MVLETLEQCAPQHQPEQTGRDWRRYAERATTYAFGVDGDMKLAWGAAYLEEKREKEEKDRQRREEERQGEAEGRAENQPAPRMRMR